MPGVLSLGNFSYDNCEVLDEYMASLPFLSHFNLSAYDGQYFADDYQTAEAGNLKRRLVLV